MDQNVILPVIENEEFERKITQANRVVDRIEREEIKADIYDNKKVDTEESMTSKLRKQELEEKYPRLFSEQFVSKIYRKLLTIAL